MNEFPRVSTGADPQQVAELQAIMTEAADHQTHISTQQGLMIRAFMYLGKPIAQRGPSRKGKRKATAHQLRTASARTRSAYVKATA